MKESDLFEPLKYYLEKQGYKVRSEVLFCDITATKGDELVVIELKRQFSIKLVMQAVKRQESADSVYVSVPVTGGREVPSNFKGTCSLLKRLELGLILVHFLKTKQKVEVVFHPTEYRKRRNHKLRRCMIREIDGRYRNFNKGGAANKEEKITAYKQAVVQVACFLDLLGEATPVELRRRGTDPHKTGRILSLNLYGWFDRVERGLYRLHAEGRRAIEAYPEMVEHFREMFEAGEK